MVDLCSWRSRIGRFHAVFISNSRSASKTSQCVKQRHDSHVQEVGVQDVLFTYVLICVVLFSGYTASQTAFSAVVSPFCVPGMFSSLSRGTAVASPEDWNNLPSWDYLVTTVFSPVLVVQHLLSARLVLLSHDVQENPGPTDSDNKGMSESRSQFESKMLDKISSMETNLQNQVAHVLAAVESQSNSLRQVADSLRVLEEDQKAIRNALSKFSETLAETTELAQLSRRKIEDVEKRQDELEFNTSVLEKELDRLESFSRRNNVKVFGVPESKNKKEEENCSELVRNLLKTYIPERDWSEDVVERAHRLGKHTTEQSKPRPLIARFQRWGDVMALMKNRNARTEMEADGLRIAQDITKRQSAKLKELRSEGKTGYYINGQLRIRDTPTVNRTSPRARPEHTSRADTASPATPTLRNTPDKNTQTKDHTQHERNSPDRHGQRATHQERRQPISDSDLRPINVTPSTNDAAHETNGNKRQVEKDNTRPKTRATSVNERQTSLHQAWGTDKRTPNNGKKAAR